MEHFVITMEVDAESAAKVEEWLLRQLMEWRNEVENMTFNIDKE